MSIKEEGRQGELRARDFLLKRGYKIFQADWIAHSNNGQWLLYEIKCQEPFTPPPFYGHGLPLYQVKARLQFQKETGIIAMLLVWDTSDNCWYCQSLGKLENGEYLDTHGQYPRRIYNLKSFDKYH